MVQDALVNCVHKVLLETQKETVGQPGTEPRDLLQEGALEELLAASRQRRGASQVGHAGLVSQCM